MDVSANNDYSRLKIACILYPYLSPQIKVLFQQNDVYEKKEGYIEYRNVSVDYEQCKYVLELLESDEETINSSCTDEGIFDLGLDIYSLYETGMVNVDVNIVEKYKDGYEFESFDFELNKELLIEDIKGEIGDVSDDTFFTIVYLELLSDEDTVKELIDQGYATEKRGYYKFSNLSFNTEKCSSILTELENSPEDIAVLCTYNTLIDSGISINAMYDVGMLEGKREIIYL